VKVHNLTPSLKHCETLVVQFMLFSLFYRCQVVANKHE